MALYATIIGYSRENHNGPIVFPERVLIIEHHERHYNRCIIFVPSMDSWYFGSWFKYKKDERKTN